MIDPQLIRSQPELVKANTSSRNMNPQVVDTWLELDKNRREVMTQIEKIRQEQNQLSEQGKQGDFDAIRQKGRELKEQEKELNSQLDKLDTEWQDQISLIPNINHPDTPIGKSEEDNQVVKEVGNKPEFKFTPKDHLAIGKDLDLMDFEAGAKVVGSQFYYLKNQAVILELALLQYGIAFLAQKGYTPFITPDLAKSRFYLGTGYAPRGDEAQIYEIEGEDLGLIATAEVTMAGLHADELLSEANLPKRYVAISHSFRKEAGAYGKYSKGLYRVHQFTKLEMFAYTTPQQSNDMHLEFLALEEELTASLGIPYRVLEMCTADLGAMAARKFDLEAWMPGRGDYGEITSTSNTTDYQSRNLNIRYKANGGQNHYLHMLNGTAMAISRTLISILENYQQADGSVLVPEVLIPYTGFSKIDARVA